MTTSHSALQAGREPNDRKNKEALENKARPGKLGQKGHSKQDQEEGVAQQDEPDEDAQDIYKDALMRFGIQL